MTGPEDRVCVFGDSFVVGVGDPACQGWVGRLAQRTHSTDRPLTLYNLGVRGNTASDVLARLLSELEPRMRQAAATGVVVSVGVNDTISDGGLLRVPAEQSTANLAAIITQVASRGVRLLIVGPTPVADEQHNARIASLTRRYGRLCSSHRVPFVNTCTSLLASPTWMAEVREGDGAHPAADGYQALAGLLHEPWSAWLARPTAQPPQSGRG